jgi:hypothetical protein
MHIGGSRSGVDVPHAAGASAGGGSLINITDSGDYIGGSGGGDHFGSA